MKIAIYHNLPSGGALFHLSAVVHALKKSGHILHFFAPSCAERDFFSFMDVVDEHHSFPRELWKPKIPWLNPFFYKKYLKDVIQQDEEIAHVINKGNYDAIYIGQCRIWTEPPLLQFLNKNIKKIIYCQEPKRSFYEKRFLDQIKAWPWWKKLWRLPTIEWMKQIQYNSISKADLVLCNSEFSKRNISDAYHGIEAKVSYIGIDTKEFHPSKQPKKNTLVSVGALDPSKNHNMVIEVAGLTPNQQKFDVILVTDRSYGNTADQLKKRAKELNVNLDIRVRVPTSELSQIYRESFAVIYCPLMEPFGIVSIEAQASGTPVLGRNEGGVKETLIDGVGGYKLFDDPQEYAKHIENWLKDSNEYHNICEMSRTHIEKNWDKEKLLAKTISHIET